MNISKVIIPVAGLGTRILPASKAVPKEMLTIVDKPVIQYLVEEAVDSGITEIIMVISDDKECIKQHFGEHRELEKALEAKNKRQELEAIRRLNNMAKIYYTKQAEPLGDGHAVLCAKEYFDNKPMGVLFGDDLIDHTTPGLKQLMQTYNETNASVIAVTKVADEDTTAYGIIKPKESDNRLHTIEAMVEKPAPEDAPSNLGVIGKYIVTPKLLKKLTTATSHHGSEIRLIDGFIELLESGEEAVYGYEVEGERFDTGKIVGLLKANIAYGFKHPKMKDEVRRLCHSLNVVEA